MIPANGTFNKKSFDGPALVANVFETFWCESCAAADSTDLDNTTAASSQVKKGRAAGRKILDSVRLASSVEQTRWCFSHLISIFGILFVRYVKNVQWPFHALFFCQYFWAAPQSLRFPPLGFPPPHVIITEKRSRYCNAAGAFSLFCQVKELLWKTITETSSCSNASQVM